MNAGVERGRNTFVFSSQHRRLAKEWSSIALISPLYNEEGGIFYGANRVANPQELQQLQSANGQARECCNQFARLPGNSCREYCCYIPRLSRNSFCHLKKSC